MEPFHWECPYCKKAQIVTDTNSGKNSSFFSSSSKSLYGNVGLEISYVVCSNKQCKEVSIAADLKKYGHGSYNGARFEGKSIQFWRLKPDSIAKVVHSSVPIQLAQDYYEACKIRDLSAKASATLSRRCIQGMIRDFCKISKNRLIDEINELKKLAKSGSLPSNVAEDTIDAIDHVRSIGNIGAHFEKDINVIIEVDPGEAQALIELIEMLFEEWYVSRFSREQKLKKIKTISIQKEELKTHKTKQINEQNNSIPIEEKPVSA